MWCTFNFQFWLQPGVRLRRVILNRGVVGRRARDNTSCQMHMTQSWCHWIQRPEVGGSWKFCLFRFNRRQQKTKDRHLTWVSAFPNVMGSLLYLHYYKHWTSPSYVISYFEDTVCILSMHSTYSNGPGLKIRSKRGKAISKGQLENCLQFWRAPKQF